MTLHRSNKPALWLLAAALTILAVTILATSAMTASAPAHAQAGSGAIPSITLESNEPGKLVITWATPDPTPTDYRLSWAHSSLGFLSYKNPNEAQRGNLYPDGDVNTQTLDGLTPGQTYKVQLRARYYNAHRSVREWSGPWTATATQRVKNHPPAAPTGLTTSSIEHDSLTLTWNNPQDTNITGYRIQRGTDANSLHTIEPNTGGPSTNYTDSTVEPETTYHYAVQALSQDGNGARSITSVTTPAEPQSDETSEEQTEDDSTPAAPTGLTASQVTHESLTLTWGNPEDDSITGYRVMRSDSATSLSTLEDNTQSVSTRYEDDTVEPETTYHYAVVALSANGDSPQSSSMSATTPAAPKSKDPPPQRGGARQTTTTEVPANWSLKPTGLNTGDQFRLIFLSSTKRNATATAIADYNTFVQTRAAAGHTDIRSYSTGFRVVGCTAAVDARDNTSTTGTGVPIYWLGGIKVADTYADFYDGDWDDETNTKNESGTNGPDIRITDNYPLTGCDHDGTEETSIQLSLALGSTDLGNIRVARPNSSFTGDGPLSSEATAANRTATRPMYGLSAVFQVADATNNAPTLANAIPNQTATVGTTFSYAFPANTFNDADVTDTLTYTATKADDTALPTWLSFTAATRTFSGTPTTAETVSVKVTASDGSASVSDTFDIMVSAAASTDATLSALTVSPKDIIGFTADRTSYEVGVASTVTQATIVATKSDSAATVEYSPTDADGTAADHQVDLSAGRTLVTVTVTAEDTTTTQTYTLSINRGVTDEFGWKASDDFDGLITAQNNSPRGIWSDETTMWVTDWVDDKLYAYDLATKARDASKDFNTLTAAGNESPYDIWSDNTTMWVTDYQDDKVYAYNLATKARDASKDFDTLQYVSGIWSDGTTMWVANQLGSEKLYAYDLTTKARDASKDFNTLDAAGNSYPGGIWSNNITMWVTDEDDAKLYAYNMATKARDAGKDFNTLTTAGNGFVFGIWANTNTMWASDSTDGKIYSYNMPAIAANTPAAGAPAITAPNVFRVPAVLGVDLSGITDTDGTVGIATNATYKWQRFDSTGVTLESDSIGTDATYTLTDTDAGKTVKVVVNFTDNASNSEGPLTSAATLAITAAASCAAPTYVGGATQIWTGKIGVKSYGNLYGFHHEQEASSLDNPTFTTESSNDYEILILNNLAANSSLSIRTDPALSTTDKRTLVLHICNQGPYEFRLSPHSGQDHVFENTGQDWSMHAERTIYLSHDTAAPTFTSATVNGSTMVITLSEDLGAAASLVNSAFTVKKGTSGTTQTLSGTPAISGSTVTLTLATAVTASDTAVKVAYTKPTSGSANKLIDKFGNETATFPDQDVTNNTTVNNPPTVANAIPDQSATVGTAFSYTFPANTFNDTNATDTLTYTAKKADDSALPTWLTFDAATRTFSGTPTTAETVSVKVTANDGTASVSDTFDIVVSAAVDTTDVWTATFTPADLGGGIRGCTTTCSTALSDDDFTYDSTDYSVISLFLLSGGTLTLTLDTDITTATNALTLVIGSSSFAFADADSDLARIRGWDGTGLSWTAGTAVAVKLT